ncbi:MAG: hypothetical protein Q9M22_05165 [Mariprofundaceae bacterium]|nr:hypothetical protein [Mariprofundaceae bacterium]
MVSGVISGAGGSVSYPALSLYAGTSITIPAGALATNATITLTASQATISPNQTGLTFAITPHGTPFNAPVTITLKFDPATLPVGTIPTQIKLIKQTTAGIQSTAANIIVNRANGTISGNCFDLFPRSRVGMHIQRWIV